MPALTQIAIEREDDTYRVTIETDDGETLEVVATFDQLDLVGEEIERVLNRNGEAELSKD